MTAAAVAVALCGPSSIWAGENDWQVVRIVSEEYRFTPSKILLDTRQPIRIEITNHGHEQHEFRSSLFRDQLIDVETDAAVVRSKDLVSIIIEENHTAVIKIIAPPAGRFDFECRIPSHHGMDGTIEVR